MVSIELQSKYIEQLSSVEGMKPIIDFIMFDKLDAPDDRALISDLSVNNLLYIIKNNLKEDFNKVVENYKRKNPEPTSPWINNNYLIFFLLVALDKFQMDKNWLKAALNVRKKLTDETSLTNDLFLDLISPPSNIDTRFAPFLLSEFSLSDSNKIDATLIANTVKYFRNNLIFPLYNDDFLNLLHLHSFQVLLDLKDYQNPYTCEIVEEFKSNFLSNISTLSLCIVYFIFATTIVIVFIALKYIFTTLDENYRNIILGILGVFGVTILEFLKTKNLFKRQIESYIKKVSHFDLLDGKQ